MADHPREQAIDGGPYTLRGITGSSALKGHVAAEPDSEIITATVVTPGNAEDANVAEDLVGDDTGHDDLDEHAATADVDENHEDVTTVYGDNAYGTGAFQGRLDGAGIDSRCKTQQPTAPGRLFTKDCFVIDLHKSAVTCPAGVTVEIRRHGMAYFGDACTNCPLRTKCTTASGGRTTGISPYEQALARARKHHAEQAWRDDYRATRPKVERKLARLARLGGC